MKLNIETGGLAVILTAIFVWAKIVGYITWSWWLIFLPVLIPFALILLLLLGIAIFAIIGLLVTIFIK